ncbi:hypothetical protein [Chryseobacterium potabilaquae]|uniref:Uncharacterized protein n=1 Tax=Chryseobacterium potabilaquae TaxID=2675057 RepID=A0A6N4X8D1_9FLAO|nr:hypothetical protein [Chryseobacterium potabilaquae]CAA7196495.1 hypothetical protein CHRY9293_02575 [Chryseobacterium potabilaquae]
MKTKSLFLIGLMVSVILIFSQLKPQDYPFYKENKNYVVDNNHLIKDVKKLSPNDVNSLLKLQRTYGGALNKNYIINVINKQNIIKGCLLKANIDWKKYGDLNVKVKEILSKYSAKELVPNYYSIQNNQVVTDAVMLNEKDITSLNKLTIIGANEVTICGEYMKAQRISRLLRLTRNIRVIDPKVNVKLDQVLVNYR